MGGSRPPEVDFTRRAPDGSVLTLPHYRSPRTRDAYRRLLGCSFDLSVHKLTVCQFEFACVPGWQAHSNPDGKGSRTTLREVCFQTTTARGTFTERVRRAAQVADCVGGRSQRLTMGGFVPEGCE
ncbi:unnamed protein product [Lampetra fluviatilis]